MSTTARPVERLLASRPLRGRDGAAAAAGVGRWPLRRLFAVGAAVTAVFAVFAVLVGGLALYRLTQTRSVLVGVVDPAQEAGQALSVGLLDQETGVRGFVLSGEPDFLDPYRSGLAAQQDAAARLRALGAGGELPRLNPDLDAVERAVTAWRTGYAEPAVAARMQGSIPPGVGVGRALFDEVRADADGLRRGLTAEQLAGRERVGSAAGFVVGAGIGVAAVMAALLVAVGVGLRRGVLGPVSRLAEEVRAVVSGDLDREVRATGPREITELGADVEDMRTHIVRELAVLQQTNRRLDEQARELERSNGDLEQFAYVASHDLQEPLRKVSSFCQLLQRRYSGRLDERADQYIEFAVDGAQRMQRLINDLLTFSRVGRTTEGFVPVGLSEVAAAAAAQLETARAETGGEIVVGDLPEVSGDPVLLRQLLVNLIANGLKFHRADVAPVVRLSAARTEGDWEITVADNGIGIESEYADKVFVIFQRLHGRDRYPGTGIGLALAKKIVEFHGGRIAIAPPGDDPGTAVRFSLPTSQENP